MPILANLTEFGSTPFFTTDELRDAGVDIALYCCGAYRAMNKAALNFYETVRRDGTQKNIIDTLQTRAELYDFLGYHAYEDKLDALFAQEQVGGITMSDNTQRPAPSQEIRRAVRHRRRQHRAVHGRPQRQRPALPRLRHPRPRRRSRRSRRSPTCWSTARCRPRRSSTAYKAKLKRLRGLPAIVAEALELVPANAHPMDVMRTGCSVLGTRAAGEATTTRPPSARDIADQLMASFGSMLLYW